MVIFHSYGTVYQRVSLNSPYWDKHQSLCPSTIGVIWRLPSHRATPSHHPSYGWPMVTTGDPPFWETPIYIYVLYIYIYSVYIYIYCWVDLILDIFWTLYLALWWYKAPFFVGIREKGRRFEAFGILLGCYEFICLTQSLGDDVWMLYLFQRYRNQNCIQLLWMILGFYFLKAPVSEDTSESLRSFPNLKIWCHQIEIEY